MPIKRLDGGPIVEARESQAGRSCTKFRGEQGRAENAMWQAAATHAMRYDGTTNHQVHSMSRAISVLTIAAATQPAAHDHFIYFMPLGTTSITDSNTVASCPWLHRANAIHYAAPSMFSEATGKLGDFSFNLGYYLHEYWRSPLSCCCHRAQECSPALCVLIDHPSVVAQLPATYAVRTCVTTRFDPRLRTQSTQYSLGLSTGQQAFARVHRRSNFTREMPENPSLLGGLLSSVQILTNTQVHADMTIPDQMAQ